MLGVLKYTPEDARSCNIALWNMAFDGHLLSQGQKLPEDKFMSRNQFLDVTGK